MDGNSKLVHLCLQLHGCVDGFSRKIMYLKYINNKEARSVLEILKGTVHSFGLPKRVRGDEGIENVYVCSRLHAHLWRNWPRKFHNWAIRAQSVARRECSIIDISPLKAMVKNRSLRCSLRTPCKSNLSHRFKWQINRYIAKHSTPQCTM